MRLRTFFSSKRLNSQQKGLVLCSERYKWRSLLPDAAGCFLGRERRGAGRGLRADDRINRNEMEERLVGGGDVRRRVLERDQRLRRQGRSALRVTTQPLADSTESFSQPSSSALAARCFRLRRATSHTTWTQRRTLGRSNQATCFTASRLNEAAEPRVKRHRHRRVVVYLA
jgi:hypothetical protein